MAAVEHERPRHQLIEHTEHAAHAFYEVEMLKRELGRLSSENNQLREDLKQGSEEKSVFKRSQYQTVRSLEEQLAELQLAKDQIAHKLSLAEKENEGLKSKVNSFLGIKTSLGEDITIPLSAIKVSKPVDCKPSPVAQLRTSRGAVSLIKAADNRIISLELELKQQENQIQSLEQELQGARKKLSDKESEVSRLNSQQSKGPDVDKLAWEYRNEANEAVILQLNEQVDALTLEVSRLQKNCVDKANVDVAKKAQQDAEARAQVLEAERESIAAEIEDMQQALSRLQNEAVSETQARMKLGKLKVALEEARGQKAQLEGQLTNAEARIADLREKIEQRDGALKLTQQKCKQLEVELKKLTVSGRAHGGVQSAEEQAESIKTTNKCKALMEQLQHMQQLHDTAELCKRTAESERDSLQEQLDSVTVKLHYAQQQLTEAAAMAVLGNAEPTIINDAEAGSPQLKIPNLDDGSVQRAQLKQQLHQLATQLEQAEFERDELRLKLEESENQVATLMDKISCKSTAFPGAWQHPSQGNKRQLHGDDTKFKDETNWQLAVGHSGAQAAAQNELQEANQALQDARLQEEALQSQVVGLKEKIVKVEVSNESLKAELLSAQQSAHKAPANVAAVDELRRQLDERAKEVADLSSLSLKADATIQQYMTQVKQMSAELRASELRLQDAQAEVQRKIDDEQRHVNELSELRGVVGALDAERDTLQAELDRKSEAAAAHEETRVAECQRSQATERALAATEGRLAAANCHISECEQQMQQLHHQVEILTQHLGALENEYDALRDEFRAVTDDLEAMVKENQVVSNQLCTVTNERDEIVEQSKVHSTRAAYHEQLVKSREHDLAELRTAYEGLKHESQRLQSTVTQLQRELAARNSELAIKCDEITSLQEAQRSAQSQIKQYIADLQAYERQFDSISRAMHHNDNVAEGLDQERQALLDQLRAAEQVRFELERSREMLQRQLAHAEGSVGILQARLEDTQSDNEAMKQRIGLEQSKVGELEGLLARARAEQYSHDAVFAASGAERHIASLKEQKGLLEDQVSTLQRQVDGLVLRRETQDEELIQLRMSLAAQHDASMHRKDAEKDNEALVAQLAELQIQCHSFVSEVESLRSKLTHLESAKQLAEAGLQAARQEIEQLHSVLRKPPHDAGQPSQEHVLARLYEMEGQNAALQKQLHALQQEAFSSGGTAAVIQDQLAELQQENDRLIDLLGRMDTERMQLERDKMQLVGEVVTLRAAAPEVGSLEDAQQQIDELEQRLHLEEAKRQQVETSFLELLSGLDMVADPDEVDIEKNAGLSDSRPSLSERPPSAVGRIKATMDQLERDNTVVRGNLQQTRLRMDAMQSELSKLQASRNETPPSINGKNENPTL